LDAGTVETASTVAPGPAVPARGQVRDLRRTRVEAKDAPRVDGDLADAAWQRAVWYGDSLERA